MKLIINIIAIVLLFTCFSFSQNTIFTNKVAYKQTLNLGDGDWDIFYELLFNNSISLYLQNYGYKAREVTVTPDGSTHILELATEETANYYFSYLNSSKILFGEAIAYDYYHFEENVPEIKWKLIDEIKKIGKFNCKKAKGTFRGRNYTAWYTEEIPINAGPWKLRGLSGLILQVWDDEGVYKAEAVNISLGKETNLEDKVGKIVFKNKRLSIDQYKKKKQSEQVETLNYINARLKEGEPLFSMKDQNKRKFIEIFKSK